MKTVIWRLMAHHKDPVAAYKWMRENSRLAIGWGNIGDLQKNGVESKDELLDRLRSAYPGLRNISHGTASLWRFAYELERSHVVIVVVKNRRVGAFYVSGSYEWCKSNIPTGSGDYFHQIPVRRLEVDTEQIWRRSARFDTGENQRWTLARRHKTVEAGS